MFKVDSGNATPMSKICSKLVIKTPERRQLSWLFFGFVIPGRAVRFFRKRQKKGKIFEDLGRNAQNLKVFIARNKLLE